MMKKIKIISCLVTLGIMVLIFSFSAQDAEQSNEVSKGVTDAAAEVVVTVGKLPREQKPVIADTLHHYVRKTAHFTLYASLGVSAFIMFKTLLMKNKRTTAVLSAGLCMLYAVSDELHQLASDGRTAQAGDVLIDTAGALAGMALLFAAVLLANGQREKKQGETDRREDGSA